MKSNEQNQKSNQGSEKKSTQNQGNFKNDPERAREAGKKGGEAPRNGNRSS